MLQLIAEKKYQPDTRDVLLQAFRTIDTQNKGYITADMMETYFLGYGVPFRTDELEAFFKVARDPATGNVYYEDYVALFPKDL
jgi:Ca2+-binding EF-hand superfamily protein